MKKNKSWVWIVFLLFFTILIVLLIHRDQENIDNSNVIIDDIAENEEEQLVTVEGTIEVSESDTEEMVLYTEEELWEKLKYQTVLIKGDNIFGSGNIFKIDEDSIYIVSNDHLTIYVMDPIIYFFDGTYAEAVNTENSEQLDMGILKVDIDNIELETLEYLETITFEETLEVEVESVVYSLGSAEGNGTSRVIGTVLELNEYHPEFHSFMTRCSGTVQAGMSGAGVFNLYGNYLGMISGAKDEEFVFLPVEIMKEEVFFGGENHDEN